MNQKENKKLLCLYRPKQAEESIDEADFLTKGNKS